MDFEGGEFVLTETTATERHAEVVPLGRGDGVVFAVRHRPVPGKRRGQRKSAMRHGVSLLRAGRRHTLGIIFHDAA